MRTLNPAGNPGAATSNEYTAMKQTDNTRSGASVLASYRTRRLSGAVTSQGCQAAAAAEARGLSCLPYGQAAPVDAYLLAQASGAASG